MASEILIRLYAQPKPPRRTVLEFAPPGDHANPPRGAKSTDFGFSTPVFPTPGAPSATPPFSGSPDPGTIVHCRIVAAAPVYLTLGFAGSMTAEGLAGSYV